ncbi:MAG: DUF3443 domain-containing protein [Proteobacteria bacterium]|nr:DUF3443 domain-containing protein [Pseudomonadota bacterium]
MSRAGGWALAVAAALSLALAACGGGGGGSSNPPAPTQNVVPIIVDGGPAQVPDLAYVSVTICTPGSTTSCQTIDHVQIDTGSEGLRILASVLSPTIALPQRTDSNGNAIGACAQFVDGYSWGTVRSADVRIAGEAAQGIAIQVIGDPALPNVPASCSSSGPPENTVESFGANGLLGVGVFAQDCGSACAQAAVPGTYYSCASAACTPLQLAVALQLQNPVTLFASDNNGVVIELPTVAAGGAATASGSLIFGIGTQADNALGSATVLTTDPATGNIVTTYNGKSYTNSYVDAGTNFVAFGAAAYPLCTGIASGFYCPATTQTVAATLKGVNLATGAVTFSFGNADVLMGANPTFYAFDNIAGPGGDDTTFAWGLPFFYGRSVYTAIEGRATPGGTGPYVAF